MLRFNVTASLTVVEPLRKVLVFVMLLASNSSVLFIFSLLLYLFYDTFLLTV